MEIDDLIIVGKLGFSPVIKGWIPIKLNPDFQKTQNQITNLFLIFTDHSVRYVTVKKIRFIQNKLYLKVVEPETYFEIQGQNNILMAIDNDTLQYINDEEYYDPIGMTVIFNDQELGKVTDWFNNGAHDVFVITDDKEKEILIPDVEEFIMEINTENNHLVVQNIQGFLEL